MKFKEMSLKLAKYNEEKICKICSGTKISIFAHTAKCAEENTER